MYWTRIVAWSRHTWTNDLQKIMYATEGFYSTRCCFTVFQKSRIWWQKSEIGKGLALSMHYDVAWHCWNEKRILTFHFIDLSDLLFDIFRISNSQIIDLIVLNFWENSLSYWFSHIILIFLKLFLFSKATKIEKYPVSFFEWKQLLR